MSEKSRVTDSSSAAPYIEEKDVILCRSGNQIYTGDEVENCFNLDMKGHTKDTYVIYRPSDIIVDAQDLMTRLPVAKEHPVGVWINQDNWDTYAKGITGETVKVVSLGDGEIGIKSSLIFYTKDLYEYYKDGNKEVSLGYEAMYRWASEEEESRYGCDIVLTEITMVNHLAVTAAGRGGSRVAIIDSVLGGIMKLKTGLFAFVASKKNKTTDAKPFYFSEVLFKHLEAAKGKTGAALEKEVSAVTDSLGDLQDTDQKKHLIDMVSDCFSCPEKTLENREEISRTVDSCYISISGESLKDIYNAIGYPRHDEPDGDEPAGTVAEAMDSDGKGKSSAEVSDTEEEEEDEEEEEETDSKKKSKKTKSKDTAAVSADSVSAIVDALIPAFTAAMGPKLESMVNAAARKAMGLPPETGTAAPAPAGGGVVDSVVAAPEVYSDAAMDILASALR